MLVDGKSFAEAEINDMVSAVVFMIVEDNSVYNHLPHMSLMKLI